MKFNLGRVFLVVLLFLQILKADVILKSPKDFYSGDSVVFSIVASGEDIKFPNIKSIDNFVVQAVGTNTQTQIINSKRTQTIIKQYVFYPTKDVMIPSFSVEIDGKVEKTKETFIQKLKVNQTKSDIYALDISIDKTSGYVSEGFLFELVFKYREDLQIASLDFQKPVFDGFWAKELATSKPKRENGFVVQKLNWVLFPQKYGNLKIEPIKIVINTIDSSYGSYSFFSSGATRSTPIYSNSLNLDIKPLPKECKLVGNFIINTDIDKTEVEESQAVSFKIFIDGEGSVDDLEDIKLDIPNATIYENPAKKTFKIKDGRYFSSYEKVYSIVSSKSYKIPSFEIKYLDKNSHKIKVLKTESYSVKVNTIEKKESKIQVAKPQLEKVKKEQTQTKHKIEVVKTTDDQKLIFFILGFISSLVVVIIIFLIYFITRRANLKDEKEIPLVKKIKLAKTKDELLKIVFVYINIDKQLDKIIFKLDSDDNIDIKNIKKDILEIVKDKKLDVL